MISEKTKTSIMNTVKIEVLFFLSFLITVPIFFFLAYYVHEGGHFFFGIVQNILVFHSTCTPYISNWLYNFGIPLPQQTHNCFERNTLIFIFGGMLGIIIVVYIAVNLLSKRLPKKSHIFLYLILLTFTLQQILDNYIFGTDNQFGRQLLDRNAYGFIFNNIDGVSIILITIFIFLILNTKIKTTLSNIFHL
jgi:ABC-type dipeptide/oligopeptide/nickel transport system permease subunit